MSWKLREDFSKRREYCVECHLQDQDVEVIKHYLVSVEWVEGRM